MHFWKYYLLAKILVGVTLGYSLQKTDPSNDDIFYNETDPLGRLWYKGNIENGLASGKGVMIYQDGSRYEGLLRDGLRHGIGITIYSKDNPLQRIKYEGSWKNDKPSGFGVFTWTSGAKYEGEFLDGLKHGRGKAIFPTSSNMSTYDGTWVEGDMSGKGVLVYKSGDKYEGEFSGNNPSGVGVFTWRNGNVHEGEYKDGQRHGKGSYFYKTSNEVDRYVGQWENDKLIGNGELFWKNGVKTLGFVENGKVIPFKNEIPGGKFSVYG